MRPIDADNIIERLKAIIDTTKAGMTFYRERGASSLMAKLFEEEELIVGIVKIVQEEPTINDWISSDKAVPGDVVGYNGEPVIVSIEDRTTVGKYRIESEDWMVLTEDGDFEALWDEDVDFWKPLPQPCKKGELR